LEADTVAEADPHVHAGILGSHDVASDVAVPAKVVDFQQEEI
jgi:hypothetical protein